MLKYFSSLHLDFSFPEDLILLPLPCFHFLIVFSNIWELPRTSVFHFLSVSTPAIPHPHVSSQFVKLSESNITIIVRKTEKKIGGKNK